MAIRLLLRSAYALFLATALSLHAHPAISPQRPVADPMDQVLTLIKSWDASSGPKQREYFVRAGEIASGLSEFDQVAAVGAALALLNDVVGKMPLSRDVTAVSLSVVAADLGALEKIAQFLLSDGNLPYGQPTEKVAELAKLLGRIRLEVSPDFEPRTVVRKVSPPAGGSGIRMPGMSPSEIADPIDRKKYEDAIRANQANYITNERQMMLGRMESEFAPRIIAVIRQASTTGKVSVEALRQAASRARLTDEERVGIRM